MEVILDHSPLGQHGQLVVVNIVKRWHKKTIQSVQIPRHSILIGSEFQACSSCTDTYLGPWRREQYAQNGVPAEVDQAGEAGGPLSCILWITRDQGLQKDGIY